MNWNSITLDKYYQIVDCDEQYSDPVQRIMAKVAICEGITLSEAMNQTPRQAAKMISKHQYVETEPEGEPVKEWEGFKFESKVRRLKAGQLIDIMAIAEDEKRRPYEKLHLYMAAIAMEDKKEGDTEEGMDYEQRCEHFLKHMPVTIATGHMSFFLLISERLAAATRLYLRMQMWMTRREIRRMGLSNRTSGSSLWSRLPKLPGKLWTALRRSLRHSS